MGNQCIAQTPSAYGSPLLIKGLLESGLTRAPEEEIVSGNQSRFTHREFAERVGRLASGLASLGVEPGDTVAIMDWDTHRYLECFFAVPMMGAVLHTVNVRLSAEQILYTINHAEDDVILINTEFLPLLQQIWDRVDARKKLVLLNDTGKANAERPAPRRENLRGARGPCPLANPGLFEGSQGFRKALGRRLVAHRRRCDDRHRRLRQDHRSP
jgi:fatty-acyl-CoA synthase